MNSGAIYSPKKPDGTRGFNWPGGLAACGRGQALLPLRKQNSMPAQSGLGRPPPPAVDMNSVEGLRSALERERQERAAEQAEFGQMAVFMKTEMTRRDTEAKARISQLEEEISKLRGELIHVHGQFRQYQQEQQEQQQQISHHQQTQALLGALNIRGHHTANPQALPNELPHSRHQPPPQQQRGQPQQQQLQRHQHQQQPPPPPSPQIREQHSQSQQHQTQPGQHVQGSPSSGRPPLSPTPSHHQTPPAMPSSAQTGPTMATPNWPPATYAADLEAAAAAAAAAMSNIMGNNQVPRPNQASGSSPAIPQQPPLPHFQRSQHVEQDTTAQFMALFQGNGIENGNQPAMPTGAKREHEIHQFAADDDEDIVFVGRRK